MAAARSAMSMLTFYENRAGKRLPAARGRALRKLFGRPAANRP